MMYAHYKPKQQNQKRKKQPSFKTRWHKLITEAEGLTVHERYVLFVLSTYFDNETHDCYPAQRTLGEKAKVTSKVANHAVNKAQELGLLYIGTADDIPKKNRRHKQLCYYKATIPNLLN